MSGVDIAMAVIGAMVVVGVAINCWMLQRIDRRLQELNERLEDLHEAMLLVAVMRQQQIESGQNPQLPEACGEIQAGEEMRNEPSQDSS